MLLEIKKDHAIEAWKIGDESTRKFLETLFGKETFTPQSIMDRVKTYQDACDVLLRKPNEMYGWLPAIAKLSEIAEALNEGWTPDWTDHNQRKWYPYFNNASNPSGGFSFYSCGCGLSIALVGSRLCFKSEELAKYAGTQFIDLYNEFLTL